MAKCVMILLLCTFALLGSFNCCEAVYLTNSTGERKINTKATVWTEEGLWSPLLETWALKGGNNREKRVMQVSPVAYVAEEKTRGDDVSKDAKEAKINNGKIINNSSVNKKPSGLQVTETDLYLLGAIEKLVYRVDFMEKRLRRVEEMLYFVMAGNRVDQEPCPDNFTRVAASCYLFASSAGREYDWKVASKYCKRIGGALAEMETIEENQDVIAYIQSSSHLRGKDFWTGGLNPGLLWIWSNSARPVNGNSNKIPGSNIAGDGRCLKLAYDPALRSYNYRGSDCSLRLSYICELPENSSSNELRRIGRSRKIIGEL